MKPALAVSIQWAIFSIGACALYAFALFMGACAVLTWPSVWPDYTWHSFWWFAGECALGCYAAALVQLWFARLPGAKTLQRPISSFFRHG